MLAMLKKPLWAHLPQVFVLGLSPNTRLLFLKNNLSSVGHEILELLFLKSNNRDVSFSTVISLFRTRKKCVFGAILVFKFPYNPHCIKNFKKNFFFQIQKFECLWNYLFKFKKQTNTEILLWAIRVLTRIFGKIML